MLTTVVAGTLDVGVGIPVPVMICPIKIPVTEPKTIVEAPDAPPDEKVAVVTALPVDVN
jgi:hypothetical protein